MLEGEIVAIITFMQDRLYKEGPLSSEQRGEFEEDLIQLCDRELDLLGDIRNLNVLYAGGSSPLWLEGLSRRIGGHGSLTALEADPERVESARASLPDLGLESLVHLVTGDVFRPPFERGTFDLVYSAGLFHELDVRERGAEEALAALAATVRPGGRVATGDFVDSESAVQLEDEELQRSLARRVSGAELYGIGPPGRLVALYEKVLSEVWWRVTPPQDIRHLGLVVLAEDEPEEYRDLSVRVVERLRERREALRGRIRREGYTRPATIYIEGRVR